MKAIVMIEFGIDTEVSTLDDLKGGMAAMKAEYEADRGCTHFDYDITDLSDVAVE